MYKWYVHVSCRIASIAWAWIGMGPSCSLSLLVSLCLSPCLYVSVPLTVCGCVSLWLVSLSLRLPAWPCVVVVSPTLFPQCQPTHMAQPKSDKKHGLSPAVTGEDGGDMYLTM